MTRAKWVLLYRMEEFQKVWIYEPLKPNGLKRRQNEGWRVSK